MNVEQKICEFEKRNKEIEKKIDKWETLYLIFKSRCCIFVTIFDYIIDFLIFGAMLWGNKAILSLFGIPSGFLSSWLPTFVIYLICFLPFANYAEKKMDYYENLHKDLNTEVNDTIDDYYDKRCAEAGIQNGFIYFTNGIAVGGKGSAIYAKLPANYGRMKIFYKEHFCDKKNLEYKTQELLNSNPGKQFLNENIASLEFNDNFMILADKETKRESLAYLSPATQLNLIKKCHCEEFRSFVSVGWECGNTKIFEICDDQLILNLRYKSAEGGHVQVDLINDNLWTTKDIRKAFNMIDLYCETFPPIALEIATIFDEKVGFLRGNAYC